MNNFDLVRGQLSCYDSQVLVTGNSARHCAAPHLFCLAGAWAKRQFGVSPVTDVHEHINMLLLRSLWHPPCPGNFVPRARERDRLISRLPSTSYVYIHRYPFSSPSVPRPMGDRYFRVAYSMASVHSTRSLCCTRRISLATRNYKLIRNQHVSPSMTDETASSPLVLAIAVEFRCTKQKKENADWEYLIREDLNELSYCLAQNPLSWSLVDHHNGLLRWRVTA